MKKFIYHFIAVFIVCLFGFSSLQAQDKTISNREAKKVAKVINHSLDDMAKSIETMDWNSLGDLINNTVVILEKHTDAIVQIASSIDTEKLAQNADKLAEKIEESIDVKKLEDQLDEVSKKLEKAMDKK